MSLDIGIHDNSVIVESFKPLSSYPEWMNHPSK